MRILTIVMTGSLLALGTGALAEDAGAKAGCSKGGRHGGCRGGMWKQFDADGDGMLSDAEKAKLKAAWAVRREARKKEMLAKYDKDGDGELSRDEKAEAWKAGSDEMRKKIFGKLDTSGDGKLSADEIQSKVEQMRARCGSNSKLTAEEAAAMKSVSEKWIKEMVGKLDADGDGQVAEAEAAAGMAAMREQCKKSHAKPETADKVIVLQ